MARTPQGTHTSLHTPQEQGPHSPVGVLEVDVDSLRRSEELWERERGKAVREGVEGRGLGAGERGTAAGGLYPLSHGLDAHSPRLRGEGD